MLFKEFYIIKYCDNTLDFSDLLPKDPDPDIVLGVYKLIADSDEIRLHVVDPWHNEVI